MDENTEQPTSQVGNPSAPATQGGAAGGDGASMNVLETYLQNFNEELSTGPATSGAAQQADELVVAVHVAVASDSNQPELDVSDMPTSSTTPSKRKTKVATVRSWGYNWLKFEEYKGYVTKVWCCVCKEKYQDRKNSKRCVDNPDGYVTGTSNVKKDTAKSHSTSKAHVKAVATSAPIPVQDTPPVEEVPSKTENRKHRMFRLFDIAYTVAYSELPLEMYPALVSLEKKHGVDLGATYGNEKSCRSFVRHIGGMMVEDMQQQFRVKPFYFSLLFDGSMDESSCGRDVVSIKFMDRKGVPQIKLLGILEPQECDAKRMHKAIVNLCKNHGLDLTNLVAIAADAASLSFGQQSRVLTRFEESAPWLVSIPCIAHRLEMSLRDSLKNTYFAKIDDMLMQLYYLFRRPSKKWKELQALAAAVEQDLLDPSTRWIDHRRKALRCLAGDYNVIVLQFKKYSSGERADIPPSDAAEAKGYYETLTSPDFIYHMALYRDIVEVLAELNVILQRDNILTSTVRSSVSATQAMLSLMEKKPGVNLRLVETAADIARQSNEPNFIFCGTNIDATPLKGFESKMKKMLKDVVHCLDVRFTEFQQHPIILASDILDITNIPDDPEAFQSFGMDSIAAVEEHFSPLLQEKGCNSSLVPMEWMKLKEDIKQHFLKDDPQVLWPKILSRKAREYPNIGHLLRILLLFPCATAHAGKQFVTIERFQGDSRMDLTTQLTEDLLRIITEGQPLAQFSPVSSVERWCNSQRRPKQKRKRKRTTTSSSSSSDTDEE